MKKLRTATPKHRRKTYDDSRISELPESILHQILSFLPTKDATRTCVLSKTWNSAWNSFSVLDFDHYEYAKVLRRDQDKCPPEKLKATEQDFIDHVKSSIARNCQNTSIQKFSLLFPYYFSTATKSRLDFEIWFNHTVSSKNVQHLVLHCVGLRIQVKSGAGLFCGNSLKELDLSGCKVYAESGIDDHNITGGFSLLKKLKLQSDVYIDEKTLQSLLSSSCSSLEEVTVRSCHGFRSLCLSSNRLKSVDLYLYKEKIDEITIESRNLRFLSLGGKYANNVLISSLGVASKYDSKNLTELVLWGVHTNEAVSGVIREFGVPEKLKLIDCRLNLETVHRSSYELEEASSKFNKTLKELSLSRVEVNDAVVRVIQRLSKLEKLKLIDCRFNLEVVQRSSYTLKELSLSRVEVNDVVVRVIQRFGDLEKLRLSSCSLTENIQVLSYQVSSFAGTVRANNAELVADCRNCQNRTERGQSFCRMIDGFYKLQTK